MLLRVRLGSLLLLVLTLVGLSSGTSAQHRRRVEAAATIDGLDPVIAAVIAETPAIDNHAHPMLAPPAMATDREFDALPVDNMEPQTDPLAWRVDYPPLAEAWAALWHFHGVPPLDTAGQQRLEEARAAVRRRQAASYPAWVLQQAGIGTMLANRVAMGAGVQPPQFLWVPYDDALLFPLNNKGLAAANPDRAQFFALEDKVRARYLHDAGLQQIPGSLDAYLRQVVTPALERQKAGGAVAVKFEVAYLRGFDFADVPREQAESAYRAAVSGTDTSADVSQETVPDPAAYKKLQDYLFRYIAAECGRLGLAVHLHGMAGGGRYFSVAGVNPMLLEPVLNDPRLRNTHFVLLHGGWPYVREAGALLQKPNFSWIFRNRP